MLLELVGRLLLAECRLGEQPGADGQDGYGDDAVLVNDLKLVVTRLEAVHLEFAALVQEDQPAVIASGQAQPAPAGVWRPGRHLPRQPNLLRPGGLRHFEVDLRVAILEQHPSTWPASGA